MLIALGADMSMAIDALANSNTDHHEEVVQALTDSIGLLKWVGGGIVTALVSAIGLLYRSLEKANMQSRADIIEQLKGREELITKCLTSTDNVSEKVGDMTEEVGRLANEVRQAHADASKE
jgi:hypothetical protein